MSDQGEDETRMTRPLVSLGRVYGVRVAIDDKVDCGGHLGAKPPTDDARLARRLLGRVEEQADVAPATLCECGKAGIRELPRGDELDVSSHRVKVVPPSATFFFVKGGPRWSLSIGWGV